MEEKSKTVSAVKHTPGPWRLLSSTEVGDSKGRIADVAVRSLCIRPSEEEIANARLIAEAGTVTYETGLTPRQLAEQRSELLEACKSILVAIQGANDGLEKQVKAAVAKAEGRS